MFDYPGEAGGRIQLSRSRGMGSGVVAACCARSSPVCPANGANRAGFKRRFPARDDCSVRDDSRSPPPGSDSCADWGDNVENDQRQASQEEMNWSKCDYCNSSHVDTPSSPSSSRHGSLADSFRGVFVRLSDHVRAVRLIA